MGDDTEKKDDGIDIKLPGFSGSFDSQTSVHLMHWIGPHLRWVVYASGWGVFVVATCYGVSLVWN